jgi:dihydrofolate reductase
MKKVIVSNYVSLDGFIEGSNREIDWFVWDEEMAKYAIDLLDSIDTILFGRVTYELMASYWPTATNQDPIITDAMNNLPKIVFSKTLEKAEWKNSRLVREVIPGEILRMKQQPGKNMVIFGSASIVSTFTQLGLIDEYRLIVNPVVLGSGKPLFKDIKERINLKLLKTKTFNCENVILYYQPT